MTMMMDKETEQRTSLRDVLLFVDFRDYFSDRDAKRDQQGNLRLACPSCGSADKCYVYSGNVFCQRCKERWSVLRWLTEVEELYEHDANTEMLRIARDEQVHKKRNTRRMEQVLLLPQDVDSLTNYAYEAYNNLTPTTRRWWYQRGVSDTAIDTFILGERKGWYSMPARADNGAIFSIKRRWHGTEKDSPTGERYECIRGSKVNYAPWILRGTGEEFAVVVGGEIKALVLWSLFQEKNIPWSVITVTTGENGWRPHWNPIANFTHIAIWPDKDTIGTKFASHIQERFRNDARIIWPEDSKAKSCDDYYLEGNDPIQAICRTMNFSY